MGHIKCDIDRFLSSTIKRCHRPLTRCVRLRVAHAPRMPGTFSPLPRVSDPDMHHRTCVTHVPYCMSGSVTCGLLWSRWREKCSRHSWHMCIPQLYVSGKKPITRVNSASIWNIFLGIIKRSERKTSSHGESVATHSWKRDCRYWCYCLLF